MKQSDPFVDELQSSHTDLLRSLVRVIERKPVRNLDEVILRAELLTQKMDKG